MKLYFLFITIIILSTSFSLPISKSDVASTSLSVEELKLYNMIMEYRKSKNLPKIHLSKSLTFVAQEHCRDLVENKPDLKSECNTHSWSDKGKWSSCCYTSDHNKASCMWDKPRELTSYKGDGFEIACGSSDPKYGKFVMTADYALESWKKSVHHNNVIINEAIWKSSKWNAIGIGIKDGFAIVWFGKVLDEEGVPAKSIR